jgi:hypothetical protein
MSLRFYVFNNEASALKYAAEHGNKAKVIYRGDYRHDWLVSVDE